MRLVLYCTNPDILHVSGVWLLYSLLVIIWHKLHVCYLFFIIIFITQFFELSLLLFLI